MNVETLAKTLGYLGLIPFVVFGLGTWTGLPWVGDWHFVLLVYAAVILSFMSAIHWGVAMTRQTSISARQLGLSVVPALIGWVAVLMPLVPAYVLLIVTFVVLYAADRVATIKGVLPEWYLPMRLVLTYIVALCLILAALSTTVRTI
jgi:hypothetical protein